MSTQKLNTCDRCGAESDKLSLLPHFRSVGVHVNACPQCHVDVLNLIRPPQRKPAYEVIDRGINLPTKENP